MRLGRPELDQALHAASGERAERSLRDLHLRCQPGHVRGQRLFVHLQRNAPAKPRNAFQRLSKFSSIVQEISFSTGMSGFQSPTSSV